MEERCIVTEISPSVDIFSIDMVEKKLLVHHLPAYHIPACYL